MYNPFPFDDPKPINRPKLSEKTINSIVAGGTPNVAKKFVAQIADRAKAEGVIVGIDGYTTANWNLFVNLVARECVINGLELEVVDAAKGVFKSGKEIDDMIDPLLIWDTKIDPTLLYGKLYHGGYIGLFDQTKMEQFRNDVPAMKAPGKLVVVAGYGCMTAELRDLYDIKCWFDITPMKTMLRIRGGEYSNIGKERPGIINRTIRRCYYCDFECAVQLRKDLWKTTFQTISSLTTTLRSSR